MTFFVGILKVTDEKRRIRIRNQVYESKDPERERLRHFDENWRRGLLNRY
jgi:hypothetical protein